MIRAYRRALAAALAASVLLPQCGGTAVEAQAPRDPRCRGHFRYVPTPIPGLPVAPVTCFDEPSGQCLEAAPEYCDHTFPGDLQDCQIACEDRGCNSARPCPSKDDACVLLPDHGTGLCVPRCIDGVCPLAHQEPWLEECAPAEPDYAGSCSGSCVVCGFMERPALRVDPASATTTVSAGSTPGTLAFKALFARKGQPAMDVTSLAHWKLQDPTLGSLSSPGVLQLGGQAGKTGVIATYDPPGPPYPDDEYISGAQVIVNTATSN